MNLAQSSTTYGNGKINKKGNVLSESQQVLRVLKLSVAILIARTKNRDFWAEGFEDAVTLLTAAPLATSRLDSAKSHLANASVYCRQFEFGGERASIGKDLAVQVAHLVQNDRLPGCLNDLDAFGD